MKSIHCLLALYTALAACPALAHHDVSGDINIATPVQITGRIADIDWGNPHTVIKIVLDRDNGSLQTWIVEADSERDLYRRGFTANAMARLEWVSVILYLSTESDCQAECRGYGLTFRDPEGNAYTLRRDLELQLRQYQNRN